MVRRSPFLHPLYLLASKVEAFLGRGQNFRFSKDIEDIVILLDGCEVLLEEFEQVGVEVRGFLSAWFRENRDDLEEAVLCFYLHPIVNGKIL